MFMLCKNLDKSEVLKEYYIEPKFDGARAIWNKNRLVFRDRKQRDKGALGIDRTYRFRFISKVLKEGLKDEVILDGEICVFDEKGISHLYKVNQMVNWDKTVFMVFDILELNGQDLRTLPLSRRKEFLQDVLYNLDEQFVKYVPHFDYSQKLIDDWRANGLEGFIAKLKESPYLNSRSIYWRKFLFTKEYVVDILNYKEGDTHGSVNTSCGAVSLPSMDILKYYQENNPKKAIVEGQEMSEKGKIRNPVLVRFL